ncbi:TPA: inverse autotransporter beta domain-containing protein [Providencia rettgeri]|nr:inverse autotransporter beta domain-containing protein [Providencia rettgeri]
MNPDTSTPKLTLRHKLSNGFVLFTAIWSSAIMPVMPSYAKMLTPDDLPTLGSDSVLSNSNSNDKTEKFIAEYSQSAARFISDKKKAADLADMAQDFARSKVTNAATDEINNWLSKAGNAKFSVDVDKKLSIKNTQLDWLVPWHDSADLLLFTQHNLHRTDGRLQANNGIGVRHFTPERMMGVNAFFDHDLSRYHSRLGLGAEYAQDFLKLSANTYMRTSSWRSASELDNDYNARPANGWDLQAEGWLPSYPNIGGNLKFEQYFGDDVALFGKDKRQKDPLATTVGVNWTPFSLVTLSAEQKISGGLSETNAKVQFTWALGKSLAEQLDPSKVGDARRLMGSRYDFVNRNNNIVLEYQKKTLITLSLPSMIQGKTGELLPLINTLNTKYPLDKLTVQAPEFLTAGGEIILDGAATRVKLPSYQVAMTEQERKKINLYRFTITASDSKGNISPQATTLVEVTNSGVLSIKQSEVIKQGNAVANGKDINTLTITARDSLGHVAPDSIVTFTLPPELKLTTQKATSSSMAFSNLFKKMQAAKSTTQQKYDIVTNMKGEASIQFTSLVTGEHHIQAVANGGVPIETAFFFIADTHQAHINHFNVLSDNAVADGKSKNKIQFHITDNNAHPIQGAMLQLDAKNAHTTQLAPTDEQGNTEVEVDSHAAGPVEITATLNEQSATVKVHFIFGKLAHVSILELTKAEAGTDSSIAILLTDMHGNTVSGADGTITVNIDGKPTPITISETFPGSGVYTGKLPGQHTGTPSITVTVDGQTSSPETLIVEQPKPISPNNSNGTGQKGEKGVIDNIVITPSKTQSLQSGDTLNVTVTITDTFGNGLSNLNTDNIDIGKHKGDTLTWTDNGDGSYTTTLPLTEVGNNDLTASINGSTSPKTDIQVNHATGTTHVDKVKITKIEKPAAGMDSTVTIELTDKYGNSVVGEKEITININGQPHTLPTTETSPGIYQVIIDGQLAGNHDLSAVVNGKKSPKELLIIDKPQPVKPKNPNGTGQKGGQGVIDKIEITTGNTNNLQSGDNLEITVTITDAFNNGLAGLNTNNIDIGKHKGDTLVWVDNGDGSYTTTLPLTEAGNNDLTASINGSASSQKQIQVSNATGKDKVSKVEIIKTEKPAAGSSSILTVELTDKNSNPVVGEQEIIVEIDGKLHTLPVKEGKPGIYEVTLPALQAGQHNIHASVNSTVSIKESLLVEQPKPISPNNSNGTGQQGEKGVVDKVAITLDHSNRFESGNSLDITVTVTDAFGNGLVDLNRDNIDIGQHKGSTLNWVDNGDGSYTTTLILTDVGSNDLTVSVNGTHSPLTEVQVNNAVGTVHVDKVKIIKTEKPSAGTNSTATIELTDKHGNPVIGEKEITINVDGQTHKLPAKEGKPGIYEATLPALQAGNHNISASVNGKGSTDTTLVVTPPTPIKPNNTGKPGEKGVVNSIVMTTGNTDNLQSGSQLEISVAITDAFGNGLTALNTNNIKLEGYNGKPVWKDNRDGSYSATITLTEVGAKGLVASIDGNKTPVKPIQINLAKGTDKVSKVAIIKTEQPAAGSSSILAVQLTDTHGNPVVGETEIIVNIDNKPHTLPAKEGKSGIYEVTLPALQTGKYDIHASVNGQGSVKNTLEVKKPVPVSSNNTSGTGNSGERGVINNITMTTGDITHLQSGDSLNITVTIVDAFNNPLTTIDTSNMILDGYKASSLKWLDKGNGTYTTPLLLTQTGSTDLTASINGHKSQLISITVSNAMDINKVANVELEPITPSEAGENQTITVKVTDKYQHPVTTIANNITVKINQQAQILQFTESASNKGSYTATLPVEKMGDYNVEVSANSQNTSKIWQVKKPAIITVKNNNGSGTENQRGVVKTVELTSSPTKDLKSGDSLQLTVTLKDNFGNYLDGVDGSHIQLQNQQAKTISWSDNRNGNYTAILPLTNIGEDDLVATVNSHASPLISIKVGNATGTTQIKQVEIKSLTKPAAGETSSITLALTDANNQSITGIDSNAVVSIDGAEELLKIAETSSKGTYTGTLSGQKAGVHKVIVTVGGVKSAESTLTVTSPTAIANNNSGKKGSRGMVNTATLTVSPSKDLKSGDTLKLTVTLKDAFDNSLTGVDLGQSLTHHQKGKVTWVAQKDGTYTASLVLTQLGQDHLFITANKIQSSTVVIDVKSQLGSNAIHKVDIIDVTPAAAGTGSEFTVALTDKNGHPVTGIKSVDVKIGQQQLSNVAVTQQADGRYTGKLPGQLSGSHPVIVTANSQASTPRPLQVAKPDTALAAPNGGGTAGARGVVNEVTLAVTPNTNVKLGDNLQLTVTLKDKFDNPLKGVTSITLQQNQGSTVTWSDNNNGSYTTTLPVKMLGSGTLKAIVNQKESSTVNITVENTNQVNQVDKVIIDPIAQSEAGKAGNLTVKIQDTHQQGVTQIANDIKVTINDKLADLKFTEISTKGTYSATLPASKAGSYTVKVTANKKENQQSWVVKAASIIKATQTDGSGKAETQGVVKTVELKASTVQNLKSGDKLTLTLTLKDAFNNTLTGIALDKITLTHNQTGKVTWTEQNNGTYTASLLLDTLGTDTLISTANSVNSRPISIIVKKAEGSNSVKQVEIINITPAAAGTGSEFTVALTDKNGHPVTGIKSVDIKMDQQQLSNVAVTQQADGRYIGTLPGQLSGSHPVIITANGLSSTEKPFNVATPDTVLATQNGGGAKGTRGVVNEVTLAVTPNTNVKSGDNLQLTMTLKDKFSNPLKGVTSITLQQNQGSTVTWSDNNNGSYTALLPLKVLGKDPLKAIVNSVNSTSVNITVTNADQVTQVKTINLDSIDASAAGQAKIITVKAKDSHGNGVTQIANDIKVTINDKLADIKFTETSTKGTYSATLPASKAGSYTVKVTANKYTEQQSWAVSPATTIKANKADGSGTKETLGVVKTVELKASTVQNLRSGDKLTLTLTLKDAVDNTLTGIALDKITLTHNQTGKVTWIDNKDGTYTASLLLNMLGNDELIATVNNINSQALPIRVEKAVGGSHVDKITILAILPTMAGAESTLAVSLTDANGHSIDGIKEVTAKIGNKNPSVVLVSQQPNGNYVGTLPGQQQGKYSLVVSVNNHDSAAKTLTVAKPTTLVVINGNGSGAKNQRGVVDDLLFTTAPTDNLKTSDKLKLTVTLKDYFDNPLRGIESKSIVINHKQTSSVVWKDNADGTYTAELLLKKQGKDTLKVTVNNNSKEVNINVGSPEGKSAVQNVKLDIINSKLSVNNSVELKLTLTDSHGNGVEKVQTNDIQVEHNNALVTALVWQEKSAGVYIASLPLHKQGRNTFVSRVNNQTNTPVTIDVSALAGPKHVSKAELKASTNQLTVGSTTELTLKLTDQWDNGIEGIKNTDIVIRDAHTQKDLTGLIWTSKGNGIYTTPAVISIAGIHSLRATVNKIPSTNVLIEVKPSTDSKRVHKVTLTATPNVITAGDNLTLSLKVTDADNNPVINLNNSDIGYTGISSKGPIIWKEDSHGLGIYTTTTMLSEVKTHTLSAGIGKFTDTTNVAVNSPMGKDVVKTITISPIADSDAGQPSSLSISLTDQYGNTVKNVSSSDIKLKINDKEQSIVFMEKNVMNKYIAQLPASKASRYKITVEVNGQSESTNWNVKVPKEILISSYNKDGLRGSLDTLSITHSATKNTVNSAEKVTLTVGLKDKFGNKLTGASSNLTLLTGLQSTSIWKELKDGFYSQELTMNKLHKQPIQVAADNILSDKIELTVAPAKGTNNVHKTTLSTDEGTIEAGKEVTLTLALTDSVDNGVIDINTKDIQLTNNGKPTNVKWTNPQDGVYTTKQRLETVGNYQFKATVNKKPSRIQTVEATYPSGKDVVNSATLSTKTAGLNAGEKTELTLTLNDQYGNLVTGVNGADIELTDNHSAEIINSSSIAWKMESVGVYKATLPLTKVGKHTLTAVVNKQNANTKEITVKALKGTSNVKDIKLTTVATSMSAGESTTLTLTMFDNYGNEVADVTSKDIKFKNTDSTITTKASWVKTPLHDSVYTAQITLEKVKAHTLSVEVNGQVKNIEIEVKPLEGDKNVAKVNLSASATAKLGVDTLLTLQLKDQFGNGVINVTNRNIQLTNGGQAENITWVEGSQGQYTTNWQSTKVGTHQLDVTVNSNSLAKPTEIIFTAPQGAESVATIKIDTLDTAETGVTVTLTLKLQDKYGNGVIDISSSDITLSSNKQAFSSLAWRDDKRGNYSTSVKFVAAGMHTLTVDISNSAKTTEKKAINIKTLPPVFDKGKSELSVDTDSVEGNGKDKAIITLKLINKNGVLISGKKPKITSSSGVLSNAVMKEIAASGVYTASISNLKAEKVMVTLDSNSIGHVGAEQKTDIYFYSFQDINYPTAVLDQQYFHFYSITKDYTDYTWENSHPDVIGFGTKLVPYIKNKPNRQKNVIKLTARPNKNSHKLEAIRATITINTYFYATKKKELNMDDSGCSIEGGRPAYDSEIAMLFQNPQKKIDTYHNVLGWYWTGNDAVTLGTDKVISIPASMYSNSLKTLCIAEY